MSEVRSNTPRRHTFASRTKLVQEMNKIAAVLLDGANVAIVRWDDQGEPILHSKHEASLWLANMRYEPADDTPRPALDVWLESEDRREFHGKVFNPDLANARPDHLNLFTGLGLEPAAGDWSLLQDHLHTIACRSDDGHHHALLAWMAQLVQQPWRKSGFAVVLRGEMGTGKSTVSDWLARIIGPRYCPVIDDPKLLTGRFNSHLETALLLRVEEGFFAGNRSDRGRMKHLLTGDSLLIERKGVDAYMAPNYARALFTSNSDWVVPAEGGERRYFVLDVSNARAKDREYFTAIDQQMRNGGAEAMLHDLLAFDISGFDFTRPPVTAGLSDQISQGFSPEISWLETAIIDGRLPRPYSAFHDEVVWPNEGELIVPKAQALESFTSIAPGFGRTPSAASLTRLLLPYGVEPGKETKGNRAPIYVFPALDKMRETFLAKHPGYRFPEPELALAA